MMVSCSPGSDDSNTSQSDFPGKAQVLAEIDSNCNLKQMFVFQNYKQIKGDPIENNITNQETYNLKFEIDKYAAKPLVSGHNFGHDYFGEPADFDTVHFHGYKVWKTGQLIKHINYTMQFIKKPEGWVVKHSSSHDGDLYPKNAFGM